MPIERPLTYKKVIKGREVLRTGKTSRLRKIKDAKKRLSLEDVRAILKSLPKENKVRFLLSRGLDARQLRARGFSAKDDLSSVDFSAKDLLPADFSAMGLLSAGYSARDLLSAGFSHADVQKAIAKVIAEERKSRK